MYRLSLPILFAIAVPVVVAGSMDGVVRLKIRPEVSVVGRAATMTDVLTFSPPDHPLRAEIGDQPLIPNSSDITATQVSHEQIEQRLRELGVDLGGVLISGATRCQITRQPAVQREQSVPASSLRRAGVLGDSGPGRTLAQVLREHADEELAELDGTVEIDFEQASRQYLDLTTPSFQFSIRSRGRAKLGLREFRVVIRRDGKTHRTVSVFGRVRLSKDVLVAQKPLSVGAFVKRDEIGHEVRLFEREEDIGIDHVEEAIGQQVVRFVSAGQMVRRSDLKSVDLVRRSRPVTVIGAGHNVHVRLTAVAMDSGSFGDTVRVRVGETRRNRSVLRAVVTGLGTVRVTEEGR